VNEKFKSGLTANNVECGIFEKSEASALYLNRDSAKVNSKNKTTTTFVNWVGKQNHASHTPIPSVPIETASLPNDASQ
jgi:hypothetical protein